MFISTWILRKTTGADLKMRSNLLIGAQHRSLFILWLKKSSHRSFVFVSNESCHDATFVFTLIGRLIPLLKEIVRNLKMVHYWTDSPASQYGNKTILKIISCHDEYFGCSASWNYMESGHGKGPCGPIGGVAKRKADQAVKNGRFIIQDAIDFFEWAKQDSSSIKFSYLSIEHYEISEKFLKATCENLQTVKGNMKILGPRYLVFL